MTNNHSISTLIIKGEIDKIKVDMGEMDKESQTFDTVLCDLVNKKAMTREKALRVADSRINLSLMMNSGDDSLYKGEPTPEDLPQEILLVINVLSIWPGS